MESLYLQNVRGLSPLAAGALFLAPALMVALSGPIGGRLASRFQPSAVMIAAALTAGIAVFCLTFVVSWGPYVAVFAVAGLGLGLGLGYTFVNVATQGLVPLERTGEASGVALTVVVTMGGIGVALASSMILGFEHGGRGLIRGVLDHPPHLRGSLLRLGHPRLRGPGRPRTPRGHGATVDEEQSGNREVGRSADTTQAEFSEDLSARHRTGRRRSPTPRDDGHLLVTVGLAR